MSERSFNAFLLSATLHAVVIALALLVSYATKQGTDQAVKVFELVAGAGDDFGAKEAPALGTEKGIKVAVNQPVPPRLPEPVPPQPVARQPEPVVQPAPTPPAPVQPAPTPPKTAPKKTVPPKTTSEVDKKLKQDIAIAKRNATRQIEKEQKAADKKRAEQERISKEQFDRENKTKKVASAKGTAVKKIDVEGVTGGVVGGSSASKKGAQGKALTSDHDDAVARYEKFFKDELRRMYLDDLPPGLADTLKVDIEVRNNADGSLANARVVKSSGNKEFDQAVLAAIRRVKLPPRPDKQTVVFEFPFTMRDVSER